MRINTYDILNKLILLYAFFIPLSLDMMRTFAISIIILGFVYIKNNKTLLSSLKSEQTIKAFGTLIFILLLSLIWTHIDNLRFGFKYITRYWYILPMFIIFVTIKKDYIYKAISAFLAGMMLSELLSYGVFFEIIHIPHVSHKDPSVFMHHTLYSLFLSFTVGILVDRILSSESLKHKLIYIFFSLTITANLFINAGRTGQVIFIFVLISVLLSKSYFNYKTILSTIFISGAIFYTAFLYSPNFQHRMKQTIHSIKHISYNTPIGSRIGLNMVAKDIFIQNPILGVGAGDYLTKKAQIVDTKYKKLDMKYVKSLVHYHNQYAEFSVIAGIFGLLAYLFIWFSISRIKIKDPHMKTIKYILLVSLMLSSLTDAMFHLNRPLSLFALFVGLLLAQKRYEQQEAIKAS